MKLAEVNSICLIASLLLCMAACSNRKVMTTSEDEAAPKEKVTREDSLSYQRGVRHSVEEKLSRKYKNDDK